MATNRHAVVAGFDRHSKGTTFSHQIHAALPSHVLSQNSQATSMVVHVAGVSSTDHICQRWTRSQPRSVAVGFAVFVKEISLDLQPYYSPGGSALQPAVEQLVV